MKRVVMIVLIVGVLFVGLYYSTKRDVPANLPLTGSAENSPEVLQQYLALEAAAAEQDATVWAMEIKAQEHERPFIELWDSVRQGGNVFQTLQRFNFGELLVPQALASSNVLSHGISREVRQQDFKTFSKQNLSALLAEWEKAGYELEQMEVRQPGFGITNGVPVSRLTFSFHVQHTQSVEKIIFRGEAIVTWSSEIGAVPVPSSIQVSTLEVLRRTGKPPFETVITQNLARVPGLDTLDPYLLVYDLNGDHFPEIALAKHNQLVVNNAGKLVPTMLCNIPRRQAHAALFADVTGDGVIDLVVADLQGVWVYRGPANPGFTTEPSHAWRVFGEFNNPFVFTAGDVDNDGDTDLFMAQYKLPYVEGQMPTPYYDSNDGFPSLLLINDGKGAFTDATYAAGLSPKKNRRTYSTSLMDLDADKDLDLVVVSDFAGIDLYLNNGKGQFTDVTREKIASPHAFGMAHVISDFNSDNALDILMIGMDSPVAERLDYMKLGRADFPKHQQMRSPMTAGNRLFLKEGDRYVETELGRQIARTGWAWGASTIDLENDGDQDLYIVNGHHSRPTAADYETQFWRHDVYVGKSTMDPARRLFFGANAQKLYGSGYSYGGYYKNKFFLNEGGTNYVEVAYLLGLISAELDSRNLVAADLHGDGKQDLIFVSFEQWPAPRQALHILANNGPAQNWLKVVPPDSRSSFTVDVTLSSGAKLTRAVTTGDSYRSQTPSMVHVGLATNTAVKIELRGEGVIVEGTFSNQVVQLKK